MNPEREDMRFLDGPWRNDACMGYAAIAMKRAGLSSKAIQKVLIEMTWCFDDTAVSEAAGYYDREVM